MIAAKLLLLARQGFVEIFLGLVVVTECVIDIPQQFLGGSCFGRLLTIYLYGKFIGTSCYTISLCIITTCQQDSSFIDERFNEPQRTYSIQCFIFWNELVEEFRSFRILTKLYQ